MDQTMEQFLKANAHWSGFYASILEQFNRKGFLSPKQYEAINAAMLKAAVPKSQIKGSE